MYRNVNTIPYHMRNPVSSNAYLRSSNGIENNYSLNLAGVVRIELTQCRDQNPMPSHLATPL